MRQVSRIAFVSVLALTGFAAVEVAAQDTELFNDTALQADWWEGNKEFGADDRIGAIQRIDQEDILGAAKLIKQGTNLPRIYLTGYNPGAMMPACKHVTSAASAGRRRRNCDAGRCS